MQDPALPMPTCQPAVLPLILWPTQSWASGASCTVMRSNVEKSLAVPVDILRARRRERQCGQNRTMGV